MNEKLKEGQCTCPSFLCHKKFMCKQVIDSAYRFGLNMSNHHLSLSKCQLEKNVDETGQTKQQKPFLSISLCISL